MTHEIGTQVRIAGDYARTIFVVASAPAADNGTVYVELADHTQGFWVSPALLRVVPNLSHSVHPPTFPVSPEDARHYDKKSAHLRSIGA